MRTREDYAIEFGYYLANSVEQFLVELNRAAVAEERPDADLWRALESAIYEFRKRAARVGPSAAAGSATGSIPVRGYPWCPSAS